MEKGTIVLVPQGFMEDGNNTWIRSLHLRELNGYDEQFLAALGSDLSPSVKTTELLARVATLADLEFSQLDITEVLLKMTVGDRIAILLNLRRLTFGEIMRCEICCPSCKEMISLDLSIPNLLQPVESLPKAEYKVSFDNFTLRLRLPTGKDQQGIISFDESASISQCAEYIARSCIVSSEPPLADELSDGFVAKVSSELEKLDPQSDILLNITCPCKHSFQSPFFVEDFFFQEISVRQRQLEQEVHWLAFYYHWSENDILSLAMMRRKRYVEIINRSLSDVDEV